MKKKAKILLICYTAALILGLGGYAYAVSGAAGSYRSYNDIEYRRAMAQLVNSMEKLDSALQKGQYAMGTVVTSKVYTQAYASAQSANTALSILPLDQYELEDVAGFISQVEEYAGAKVSAAADGVQFSDEDRKTAGQLAELTGRLTQGLSEMYRALSGGTLTIRGPKLTGLTPNVLNESEIVLEDTLLSTISDFPEPPELNYDGRYSSDHSDAYAALSNLPAVTETEAMMVAQELLKLQDGELTSMGRSDGAAPAFYFGLQRDTGNLTIAVTQAGGKVLLYMNDHLATEERISVDEARNAAAKFLERAGYEGMTAYEERRNWGLLELTYVYQDGEITSLGDTVKVSVNMDDGTIAGFDAAEFLRNHVEHDAAAPGITKEETQRSSVPGGLTVNGAALTYYTAESGKTTLCWRFQCQTERGEICLVYADANTGKQVEIVTDTKTLTM